MPLSPLYASISSPCRDLQFVFIRGSGAAQNNSKEWQSFQSSVDTNMANANLSYEVTDLEYPAVGLDNLFILVDTVIGAGNVGDFADSVSAGTSNLVEYYQKTNSACPATKWVLFGYSQGAKVLAAALSKLDSRKVIYAATFGDPNLYLPEGAGLIPPACMGRDFSDYRVYVPNCRTSGGILGARNPYIPTEYSGKLGLWCNDSDLICGSSKNLFINSGHLEYHEYAGIPSATELAIRKVRSIFPEQFYIAEDPKLAAMDTAFLIDATGSMSEYIHRYKAEALRLASATIKNGGRIALYIYRDIATEKVSTIQLCDFSCTLSEFTLLLHGIVTFGGGDYPESLLSATLHAMNTLSWQVGATKSIIALTDAPYHNPDHDGTTLSRVIQRSLEIDPVNIYVITEEGLKDYYSELTELTGGRVFGFDEIPASTDYVLSRPIAILPQEYYYGLIGDIFLFDASMSYSLDDQVSHYDWDLDGDGIFEIQNHTATIEYTASQIGESFIVVRVVSENGTSSTMSAKMIINEVAPPQSNLLAPINLSVNEDSGSSFSLEWQNAPNAAYNLLVVDGVIIGLLPSHISNIDIQNLDLEDPHEFILSSVDSKYNLGGMSSVLFSAKIVNAIKVLGSSPATLGVPSSGYQ